MTKHTGSDWLSVVLSIVIVQVLLTFYLGAYVSERCGKVRSYQADSLTTSKPLSNVLLDSTGSDAQTTRPEAPYKQFCEPRPYGEKELWNSHKKIISYSMFVLEDGNDVPDWLWDGFVLNVELARRYYPDWVVRVYSFNLNQETVDRLVNHSNKVEVVRCHSDSELNKFNMGRRALARFLAVDDPTVRYTLVRDLDSRFSPREVMAVNEWIASDEYSFHTMRDHKWHAAEVLAGCFGMKRSLFDGLKTTMTDTLEKAFARYPNQALPGPFVDDQNFLKTFIWPLVRGRTLDHDIDRERCILFGAKECRDYPLGNRSEGPDNFFVGAGFKDERAPMYYQCSLACTMTEEKLETLV